MKTDRFATRIAISLALWIVGLVAVRADQVTPPGKDESAAIAPATREKLKDRPLTLVKQIRPQYPDAARKDALAGQVQLEATIDEEGSVESLKTLSGNSILAEAAAAAVRRWVYESAVVNGKAIKSTTTVKLNFKAPEPHQ